VYRPTVFSFDIAVESGSGMFCSSHSSDNGLMTCLSFLNEYTTVTDRQTDGKNCHNCRVTTLQSPDNVKLANNSLTFP